MGVDFVELVSMKGALDITPVVMIGTLPGRGGAVTHA
jgi:hypothetical protein